MTNRIMQRKKRRSPKNSKTNLIRNRGNKASNKQNERRSYRVLKKTTQGYKTNSKHWKSNIDAGKEILTTESKNARNNKLTLYQPWNCLGKLLTSFQQK